MGHSTADEIIEVAWQKFLLSKTILATCFNIRRGGLEPGGYSARSPTPNGHVFVVPHVSFDVNVDLDPGVDSRSAFLCNALVNLSVSAVHAGHVRSHVNPQAKCVLPNFVVHGVGVTTSMTAVQASSTLL